MMHFDRCILVCILTVTVGFSVVGCSPSSDSEIVNAEPDGEVVEGGTVVNLDRDRVQDYLNAFAEVRSVEEEERLATDFADWLNKNGYKIVIEETDGKHVLSCPYFPPVTPWTRHTFRDVKNLDLLPK